MMAHDCPECGELCYCDIEDHMNEAPDDCCHTCAPEDDADELVDLNDACNFYRVADHLGGAWLCSTHQSRSRDSEGDCEVKRGAPK